LDGERLLFFLSFFLGDADRERDRERDSEFFGDSDFFGDSEFFGERERDLLCDVSLVGSTEGDRDLASSSLGSSSASD
jgi:hypothetical protein